MFTVGATMVWFPRWDKYDAWYGASVKIVKVNSNGILIELADGSRKRAARDDLKWPKPKPMPRAGPHPCHPLSFPWGRLPRCGICGASTEQTFSERCRGACA